MPGSGYLDQDGGGGSEALFCGLGSQTAWKGADEGGATPLGILALVST